jgi:predicted metallopeptidase
VTSAAERQGRLEMDKRPGFDFTAAIYRVVTDMAARLPELAHIQSLAQARNRSRYGTYATLTPMRFDDGSETIVRNGVTYKVQRLINAGGDEILYILTFYLPRFMDVPFHEKLVTIVHELWHISPQFNGDLRRHPGRCYAHTQSLKAYDGRMAELAERWLRCDPPVGVYSFLQLSFAELQAQHGRVFGTRVRQPKLVPIQAEGRLSF